MSSNAVVHRLRRAVDKGFTILSGTSEAFSLSLTEPTAGTRTLDSLLVSGWIIASPESKLIGEICCIPAAKDQTPTRIPLKISQPRGVGTPANTNTNGSRLHSESVSLGSPPGNARLINQEVSWDDLPFEVGEAITVLITVSDGQRSLTQGPIQVFRELPASGLRLCVESPHQGDTFSNNIAVKGFVATLTPERVNGVVFADSTPIGKFVLDEHRADVISKFKLGAEAGPTGYSFEIPWTQIQVAEGKKSVELSFEARQDGKVVRIGPVTVNRGRILTPSFHRRDYKSLWNSLFDSDITDSDYEDLGSELLRAKASAVIDALKFTTEDVILDLFCGAARVAPELLDKCKAWVGADLSTAVLACAREKLRNNENASFVELMGVDLVEFEQGCFDHAYCSMAFAYLEEWDRFNYVKEIYRVIRPGGRFYCETINLGGSDGFALLKSQALLDSAHREVAASRKKLRLKRGATAEELKTYFEQAGFTDISTKGEPMLVSVVGQKPEVE